MGPGNQVQTQSGTGTVSATADGMTITTHLSGFLNRQMTFTGSTSRTHAGQVVEIQRYGHATKDQWINTASASIGSNGAFTAAWRATTPGRFAIRAIFAHPTGASVAAAWPTVKMIVYRMAIATIYGAGFWGSKTACGETLHRVTLGVANRTLPCGTRVSIYFNGLTIVVPVIDRGPYANHADWDLTSATAHALHMDGTEHLGAAAVSHP
jgi:rare lipoprotein A (peptidoglycan hydrolase)